MENLTFLPINLRIDNRKIVIIGGGKVGTHKAEVLKKFTTKITVISRTFLDKARLEGLTLVERDVAESDLDGAGLVYICTENETLNRALQEACHARGLLCSVCDNAALCDFTSPAVYREGNITVSVASNAKDVRRSIAIRNKIAESGIVGETAGESKK